VEKWRSALAAGNIDVAWSEFIERYRKLIFTVIRRSVYNENDADEIFADICAELASDSMSRLARHDDSREASFSTWLVTVVHRLVIDWVRHRDGRPRIKTPDDLSPLQRFIFDRIVRQRYSYVEAYELAVQRRETRLSFNPFMKEVRLTLAALEQRAGGAVQYFPGPPEPFAEAEQLMSESMLLSDASEKMRAALSELPPEERLAIQLFIVEEVPAGTVAKIVGWSNPKSVYNRVYRALEKIRQKLPDLAGE